MSTRRPNQEARHRWTPKEEDKLRELSKPFNTIGEAADAVYVEMSMPRHAVYAKLYSLWCQGLTPWLEPGKTPKARQSGSVVSADFQRKVWQFVRAMRTERLSGVLITVGSTITVEIQRSKETFTLDAKGREE